MAANRTLRNNPGTVEDITHRKKDTGWCSQNN